MRVRLGWGLISVLKTLKAEQLTGAYLKIMICTKWGQNHLVSSKTLRSIYLLERDFFIAINEVWKYNDFTQYWLSLFSELCKLDILGAWWNLGRTRQSPMSILGGVPPIRVVSIDLPEDKHNRTSILSLLKAFKCSVLTMWPYLNWCSVPDRQSHLWSVSHSLHSSLEKKPLPNL